MTYKDNPEIDILFQGLNEHSLECKPIKNMPDVYLLKLSIWVLLIAEQFPFINPTLNEEKRHSITIFDLQEAPSTDETRILSLEFDKDACNDIYNTNKADHDISDMLVSRTTQYKFSKHTNEEKNKSNIAISKNKKVTKCLKDGNSEIFFDHTNFYDLKAQDLCKINSQLQAIESCISQSLNHEHLFHMINGSRDKFSELVEFSESSLGVPALLSRTTQRKMRKAGQNSLQSSFKVLLSLSTPHIKCKMAALTMAFNPLTDCLFAVSYGDLWNDEIQSKVDDGAVMLWSLKNCYQPRRQYKTDSGVIVLQFSKNYPNLLAGGTRNGQIYIWDLLAVNDDEISHSSGLNLSTDASMFHDPIIDIKWEDSGDRLKEGQVCAISSSGKRIIWKINSDEFHIENIPATFKYENNPNDKDLLSSEYDSILCVDYNPKDSSSCLIGFESGIIILYSTIDSNYMVDRFLGHKASVLKISFNPNAEDFFLSCSLDMTIRLWDVNKPKKELCKFATEGIGSPIVDISWSKINPLEFMGCTNDSRVDYWNISEGLFDPVDFYNLEKGSTKISLISIKFANSSCFVVTTDSQGVLTILSRLSWKKCYKTARELKEEFLEALNTKISI